MNSQRLKQQHDSAWSAPGPLQTYCSLNFTVFMGLLDGRARECWLSCLLLGDLFSWLPALSNLIRLFFFYLGILYFVMFYCYLWDTCSILVRDLKGVDSSGSGNGEELEGIEGGKTLLRLNRMREETVLNERGWKKRSHWLQLASWENRTRLHKEHLGVGGTQSECSSKTASSADVQWQKISLRYLLQEVTNKG